MAIDKCSSNTHQGNNSSRAIDEDHSFCSAPDQGCGCHYSVLVSRSELESFAELFGFLGVNHVAIRVLQLLTELIEYIDSVLREKEVILGELNKASLSSERRKQLLEAMGTDELSLECVFRLGYACTFWKCYLGHAGLSWRHTLLCCSGS